MLRARREQARSTAGRFLVMRRVMTASRYSLGTTSVPSSATLNSSISARDRPPATAGPSGRSPRKPSAPDHSRSRKISSQCCGRAVAEHKAAGSASDVRIGAEQRSRCALLPHSAGDFMPGAGGTYLPMVLNSWPMKLSGVQLVSPILPPGLQTRSSSFAACSWLGVNITPKVESTTSKLSSANGRFSASASLEGYRQPVGGGALAPALEQRTDIIGRDHIGEAARRGKRGIAVAGCDIQHALAAAEIDGLAQHFAYNLQGGADDGIVAGRPRALLARLHGIEVDGRDVCTNIHGCRSWLGGPRRPAIVCWRDKARRARRRVHRSVDRR